MSAHVHLNPLSFLNDDQASTEFVLIDAHIEESQEIIDFLSSSSLMRTSLKNATLQNATLQGANLQAVKLRSAKLESASINGARLKDVALSDTNQMTAALKVVGTVSEDEQNELLESSIQEDLALREDITVSTEKALLLQGIEEMLAEADALDVAISSTQAVTKQLGEDTRRMLSELAETVASL